jgi:hypothetical protein
VSYLEKGLVSLMNLSMIEENSELLKEISYNNIKNTFDGLHAAPRFGILVGVPTRAISCHRN